MTTRLVLLAALIGISAQFPAPNELGLPNRDGALRFAVIGDTGTGSRRQAEVADQMLAFHRLFPFDLTLMLGDNLYGAERPSDYAKKFERPYGELLAAGVTFRAVLGNHDEPAQRFYEPFNMGGERYYTFTAATQSVRFVGLDSTLMDEEQVEWLRTVLSTATEDWTICFFHHPIYSSGERHGPDLALRATLEPVFMAHGVNVVFSGHEHFYERLLPQRGIDYFISGAGARVRRGNVGRDSALTAQRFDGDLSFMLLELDGRRLSYQAIARTGRTVDMGEILHPRAVVSPRADAEERLSRSRAMANSAPRRAAARHARP